MNTKAKKIISAISFMLILCLMLAGCAPTAAAEGEDASGGIIQMVLMFAVLAAVMYFFMIRPERKRKKETEELRSSLAVGDPITTIGGMTGKIVSISDENIVFETGEDRVRIEVKKWAINKKAK